MRSTPNATSNAKAGYSTMSVRPIPHGIRPDVAAASAAASASPLDQTLAPAVRPTTATTVSAIPTHIVTASGRNLEDRGRRPS